MFCSFQDGLAEIKLDEEGLPVILPTPYGAAGTLEGKEKEIQSKPRNQVINHITMQRWREFREIYCIKKARIPRRKK